MNELKEEILTLTGKEIKTIYCDVNGEKIDLINKSIIDISKIDNIILEYKNGELDVVSEVEYSTKAKKLKFDYINVKQRFIALFLSPIFWIVMVAIFFIVVYSEYLATLLGYIMAITLTRSSKVYKRYGIERFKIVIPINRV